MNNLNIDTEKLSQLPDFYIKKNIAILTTDDLANPKNLIEKLPENTDIILLEQSEKKTSMILSAQELCTLIIRGNPITEKEFRMCQTVPDHTNTDSLIQKFLESGKDFIELLVLEDGQIEGYLRLTPDIISSLAQHKQSQKTEKNLMNQIHQRDDFLNIVCHDLRNPLGVIGACCDFILDEHKKEKNNKKSQTEFLGRIKGSIKKASEMINNLLDMSRIKSTGSVVTLQPTNLYDYLDDIKDNLNILASSKSITIEVPESDLQVWVNIDPPRFSQIIENLVINAIKFSPKKTTIKLTYHMIENPDDETKPSCSINIIDQGYGIPEDKVKTLFNIFEQGDSDADVKSTGFGIGLFIVKQFTHLHNGRIEVKNNTDQGSTFSIVLPRVSVGGRQQLSNKIRVLLVEDDEDVLEYLQLALEEMDFDVTTAPDGDQASARFRERTPDFILSDLKIPKKDGFELLQEIKNIKPEIPYVLMTGFYDNIYDDQVQNIFRADRILHKPFGKEELEECIKEITGTLKKSA